MISWWTYLIFLLVGFILGWVVAWAEDRWKNRRG